MATILLIVSALMLLALVAGFAQSNIMENADADPRVLNAGALDGGKVRSIVGVAELDAADVDEAGKIVELCRLPAGAVVQEILIANEALDEGTSLVMDLGLLTLDGDEGDEDVYADGSDQFQSAAGFTDLAFDTKDEMDVENFVYQDAGDDEDDHDAEYLLALTVATAAGTEAAGSIAFMVRYAVPA